jgi:MFS family permease
VPQSKRNPSDKTRHFHGPWIVATAFVTFGLAVGVPYYNLPFFYDYFQKTYHWDLREITLGFPVAALLSVWVGPLIVPRFSPRKLIVAGTSLTALSFLGFARMNGALSVYFALYFFYTLGYLFAGPIPHQMLVSYWYHKKRGSAMGVLYVGIGLVGGLGSFFVRSLTDRFGFEVALSAVGLLMLLAWPLAMFFLKDRPAELGEYADGADRPPQDVQASPYTFAELLRSRSFWLLLVGSICSIGSIGCINIHMKFVFRDAGYTNQKILNAAWTSASVVILWSSIVGRLGIGHFADVFSKRRVMIATYFLVALTILVLFWVSPARPASLYVFALVFGFAMGADYMLIPLMAAEQFGVNTLARAMALILPANTIGQTWCPYLVSALREHYGSYLIPLAVVFAIAMLGAFTIALIPSSGIAGTVADDSPAILAERSRNSLR